MKKILSLLLVFLMLLGLCSCKKYEHGSEEVVLKLGENKVTEEVYRYFLLSAMDAFADGDAKYYVGEDREERLAELNEQVISDLKRYYSVRDFAKQYDIELTRKQKKELKEAMQDLRDGYKSDKQYKADLAGMYLSEYMTYSMFYYESLYSAIYKAVSQEDKFFPLDDDTVMDYAGENFIFCRQIVVTSKDAHGNGEAIEKAQKIRDRLLNGETAVDVLGDYLKDETVAGVYYCFAETEDYTTLDEEAIMNMEIGEVSDIFSDGNGFQIIVRTDVDEKYLKEHVSDTVFESYCMHRLNLLLQKISDNYTVTYVDTREPEDYR